MFKIKIPYIVTRFMQQRLFQRLQRSWSNVALLALWLLATVWTNTSYAACNTLAEFSSQSDNTGTMATLLAGCSPTNGQFPNAVFAMVGGCLTDAINQPICNDSTLSITQAQCQSLYQTAYYAKVQAACNYWTSVLTADVGYKAPPPQPPPPSTSPAS